MKVLGPGSVSPSDFKLGRKNRRRFFELLLEVEDWNLSDGDTFHISIGEGKDP